MCNTRTQSGSVQGVYIHVRKTYNFFFPSSFSFVIVNVDREIVGQAHHRETTYYKKESSKDRTRRD